MKPGWYRVRHHPGGLVRESTSLKIQLRSQRGLPPTKDCTDHLLIPPNTSPDYTQLRRQCKRMFLTVVQFTAT